MNHDDVLNAAKLSRRNLIARAAAGAGAVAVGTVASTVWSRSASAAITPADHAAMHAVGMRGIGMPGMIRASTADVSAPQQNQQPPTGAAGVVNMEGDFYKSVRLPPKPNATPLLNKKQIEEFERTIACPCPCTLDVFTCRTTDFACGNSPAVHADVQAMVKGGYNADEILQAMIGTYGNNILMAPPKKGVNLIAWFAPFAALGAGAILVNAMLRGWRKNSQVAADRALASMIKPAEVVATDDEMARLRKALRDDTR
ncbi:MAG: cytochrome c-type biogenesis protein CcmH [Phycisphaerae bacterium]|nr:cytochrome c-type biogenesis protein CcmH [Gemmatimonadaceae bacterium]